MLMLRSPSPISAPLVQPVLRLIVEPDRRPGWFIARLESNAEIIVLSDQPLADATRVLLDRGFDPAALLTMRHAGKPFDSFRPAPIRELAKWTYHESAERPLRQERWMPFAGATGRQKSSPERAAGPGPTAGKFVPASHRCRATDGVPGRGAHGESQRGTDRAAGAP
jgi:hypothetical protein